MADEAAASAEVANLVAPMSVEVAYSRHWALLLAGDDAGAQAVLDRAAKLGITLPAR